MTGENKSYSTIAKLWWDTPSFKPMDMMPKNKSVCGFHLGYLSDDDELEELVREAAEDLVQMYEKGQIKPKIDSVWPFEKVGLIF